jgi:glycosyltransferase involved in cell wall biosynthesis
LKKENQSRTVIYAGRYNETEILSGPEKVAKRIFGIHGQNERTVFIQYFFDGSRYGMMKKLFGKEIKQADNGCDVATLGLFRLLFFCLKFKPSVIHVITFERFAVFLYLLKIFRKVKFVYTLHGIVSFGNKLKKLPYIYRLKDRICEKIFIKYSGVITIPSSHYIEMVKQFYEIDDRKIKVVPNGCDKEFSEVIRNGNSSDKLNLFLLSDKIGFDSLRDVIAPVLSTISAFVEVNEIGYGLTDCRLENLRTPSRMDTAKFACFMGKMDVFLSLHKYDTFSITSLEAMAAGVIPVITNETGLSEYINDGENGFLVKYGDAKKILDIINLLRENCGLRKNISDNARKIYGVLNLQKVYGMYSEIYYNTA